LKNFYFGVLHQAVQAVSKKLTQIPNAGHPISAIIKKVFYWPLKLQLYGPPYTHHAAEGLVLPKSARKNWF
jgi:hypothetical protein